MSSVSSFDFEGITGYQQISETTSDTVSDLYKKYIDTIKNTVANPAPTAEQMKALQEAINGLVDLLQKGKKGPSDPNDPNSPMLISYMTEGMVTQATIVLSTLKMAGIDIANQPITLVVDGAPNEAYQTWRNLVVTGNLLQGVFDYSGSYENHTLMYLIAMDFIKHGNELISGKLDDLARAIQTTKTSLDSLKTLMEMQNQVAVVTEKFSANFNFSMGGTPSDFAYGPGGYAAAASTYFGKDVQQYIPYNYTLDFTNNPAVAFAALYKLQHNGQDLSISVGGQQDWIYAPAGTIPQSLMDKYHITYDNAGVYTVRDPAFRAAVQSSAAQTLAQQLGTLKDTLYYTFEMKGSSIVITPNAGQDTKGSFIQNLPYNVHCSATDEINKVITMIQTLSTNIAELTKITPRLPDGSVDPNSSLAKMKQVYDDLKAKFVTPSGQPITKDTPLGEAFIGFKNWVLDSSSAQNINFAITAAQSLNDQQKEDVRQATYNYEEWTKVAAAIIQVMQTIADKILQNVR